MLTFSLILNGSWLCTCTRTLTCPNIHKTSKPTCVLHGPKLKKNKKDRNCYRIGRKWKDTTLPDLEIEGCQPILNIRSRRARSLCTLLTHIFQVSKKCLWLLSHWILSTISQNRYFFLSPFYRYGKWASKNFVTKRTQLGSGKWDLRSSPPFFLHSVPVPII